jgi:hypothetical protein
LSPTYSYLLSISAQTALHPSDSFYLFIGFVVVGKAVEQEKENVQVALSKPKHSKDGNRKCKKAYRQTFQDP